MRHTVISSMISAALIGVAAGCAPIAASDAGRPMDFPHRSTAFGLPSTSPAVQSLTHQAGQAGPATPSTSAPRSGG